MIILRCANGVALFRIRTQKQGDELIWLCLTDGSSGSQPRTSSGIEQALKDMVSKAQALRGPVQQIVDLLELS